MRSSDTIAELAGALAKAQVALQNPAKSLIAYLEPSQDGSPGQAYRYAPLSAGLEIVRKALGQHAIAVLQTTELDQGTDTLMLTTTLAHASGEWMASSWPVCGRPEMAHPKVMGAALTYARRYSLFAVVGLAGEDDLDGPELSSSQRATFDTTTEARTAAAGARPPSPQLHRPHLRVVRARTTGRLPQGHDDKGSGLPPVPAPRLADLIGDLEQVQSPDALLRWSISALPAANGLKDSERAELQAAFLARAKEVGADRELLLALKPARSPRRLRTRPATASVMESSRVP